MKEVKERLLYFTSYDFDSEDDGVWYWEDFVETFNHFFKNKKLIVKGYVERWDGRYNGSVVCSSLYQLLDLLKDCGIIKFWDENGHLFFLGSHHDGTNIFEIKTLNEKGENRYYRTNSSKGLFQSAYSKLPHFAHLAFGHKKIEYSD